MSTFLILLAAFCWGLIGLFTRTLSALGLTSLQIAALRSIVSAILMIGFLAVRSPKELKIRLKDLWMFFGTGVCSLLFFNVCYFTAINLMSLSVAAILLYTAPIFVMILSAIFFREKITKRKLLALVLALGGCALVTGVLRGELVVSAFGLLVGIGSGFGYSLYSIFSPIALKKYSTLTVTTYTFVMCGLCSLVFLHPVSLARTCAAAPAKSVIMILLLAVIATVAPYLLYTEGLKHTASGRASVMASLEPVVASLVGVVVFHETMGIDGILGTLAVLAAVVLLNVGEKGKEKK